MRKQEQYDSDEMTKIRADVNYAKNVAKNTRAALITLEHKLKKLGILKED